MFRMPRRFARRWTQLRDKLGPISAVVTSAGYYEMAPVAEISADAWRRMLRVHLGGLVNVARATLPDLVDHAAERWSRWPANSPSAAATATRTTPRRRERSSASSAASPSRSPAAGFGSTAWPRDRPTPRCWPPTPPGAQPNTCTTLPLRRLTTPAEVARCVEYLVCDATFSVGDVVNVNSGAVI